MSNDRCCLLFDEHSQHGMGDFVVATPDALLWKTKSYVNQSHPVYSEHHSQSGYQGGRRLACKFCGKAAWWCLQVCPLGHCLTA